MIGGDHPQKGFHEIDETRAATRDEAFEEIIRRIKAAGAVISKDETSPFYTDVGAQEFELGTTRVVEFNLNNFDFLLTRKVENFILQGAARQKHTEPLTPPRFTLSLKRKGQFEEDWVAMEIGEIF